MITFYKSILPKLLDFLAVNASLICTKKTKHLSKVLHFILLNLLIVYSSHAQDGTTAASWADPNIVATATAVAVAQNGDYLVARGDVLQRVNSNAAPGANTFAPPPSTYYSIATGNWNDPATWSFSSGGAAVIASDLPIPSGSTVIIEGGFNVTSTTAGDIDINQTIDIQNGILTLNNGNTNAIQVLTTSATSTVNLQGGTLNLATATTINGALNNGGGDITGTLTFADGSTYIHARDGGVIPTATWGATSECRITGLLTSPITGGFGQTFGDFTWNCTNQDVNQEINADMTVVNDLHIVDTNKGSTGDVLFISSNTTNNKVLTNNFIIDAEARFFYSRGTASAGTLEVTGDYTVLSGGQTGLSQGTGTLQFTGAGTQTITNSASIFINGSNRWNVEINKPSGEVLLASNFSNGGIVTTPNNRFTITSGTLNFGTGAARTLSTGTLEGSSGSIDMSGQPFHRIDVFGPSTYSGTLTVGNLNTIHYRGDVAQSLLPIDHPAIVLEGTGVKTLSADIGMIGNFTNNAGLALFDANNFGVTFNGTAAQSITGATTFHNVTLSNTSNLTLNDDITVDNALTLTDGRIVLGTNSLTYGGTEANLTRTNGWVETDGTGLFVRSTAGTDFTFPVGDATNYQPVQLGTSVANASARFGTPTVAVPNSGVGAWFVNNTTTASDVTLIEPQGGSITSGTSEIGEYTTPWGALTTTYPIADNYQTANYPFSGVAEFGVFTNSSPVPTITSFTPTSGVVGTTVTITGTGFDPTPANNLVYFGGARATVTSASTTSLDVTVPSGTSNTSITVQNITNHLQANSLNSSTPLFLVDYPAIETVNSTTYTNASSTNSANQRAFTLGDFNNDGSTDVATVSNSLLEVRLNTGTALGAVATPTVTTNFNTRGVTVGLFDNDNFLDIVTANQNSSSITFFKGNGDGTFTTGVTTTGMNVPTEVTSADINNDGYLDLITSHSSGDFIRIHSGNGDGTFNINILQLSTFNQPGKAAIADFNRDGLLDILTGTSSATSFRYFEQGAGTTFTPHDVATSQTAASSFAIADYNEDGFLDVIVGRVNNGTTTLHLGTVGSGASYFNVTTSDITQGGDSRGISTGDLNGDRHADFIITDYTGTPVQVRLGNGNGTFGASFSVNVGQSAVTGVAIADISGDGFADIISHTNNSALVVSEFTPIIPMTVASSVPAQYSTTFTPADAITITMSDDVNATTVVDGTSILVKGDRTGVYNATPTVAGTDITFDPPGEFLDGENITVTLTDAITSTVGTGSKPLVGGYTLQFSVKPAATLPSFTTTTALKTSSDGVDFPNQIMLYDFAGNDGEIDILVKENFANVAANDFIAFVNTGTVTFGGISRFGTDNPRAFDFFKGNDAMVELAVIGNNINEITGVGGANTSSLQITNANPQANAVTLADIDNDGFEDIVTAVNGATDEIRIFFNDGAGGYNNTPDRVDFATGGSSDMLHLAAVDYDSDGDLDIIAMIGDQTVRVYYNFGSRSFSGPTTLINTGGNSLQEGTFSVADYTGDGKPDITYGSSLAADRLVLSVNNHPSVPTTINLTSGVTGTINDVKPIDWNGDATMEMLVSGTSNKIALVEDITGTPAFTDIYNNPANANNPIYIDVADIDNDNDVDIVAAVGTDEIVWLENTLAAFIFNGAVDNNWSVIGNWAGNTLPGNGDDIIIQGPAVIDAALGFTYGNVIIDATHSLDMNGFSLAVNDLTLDGTLTANAGTPTLTINGNYTQNTGSTFTSPNLTTDFTSFTGVIDGTANPVQFNNLSLTSPANITLGANVDINGNLTMGSTTGLDVSASNFTINIAGNWDNQGGIFTPQNGEVIFDGVSLSNQLLTNFTDENFFNLTMNNSSGFGLDITGAFGVVNVAGTLNLQAGNIITNPSQYLVLADGATITNGGPTSYIEGPLAKEGNAASITFHIGNNTEYAPITLNNLTGFGATDGFLVEYSDFGTSSIGTGVETGVIDLVHPDVYWTFALTNGGTPAAQIQLEYDDLNWQDLHIDVQGDLRVAGFDSGADNQWESLDASPATSTTSVGSDDGTVATDESAAPPGSPVDFTVYNTFTLANTDGGGNTFAPPPPPIQPVGNEGIYFDGADDYVEVVGYTGVTGTASRTVEAWIKTTAASANRPIVEYGNPTQGNWFIFNVNSGGFLQLAISNNSATSTTVVNDGAWHHVAVVITDDGSPNINEIDMYIDGVPATYNVSGGGPGSINTFSSVNVHFGYSPGLNTYFNGQIDELRIYNTARTALEIQSDMGSSTADGAIGYWNFDEGTGTTATDSGSGANNGTLTGPTDLPLWALRVTNQLDDTNPGSLRWAITEANNDVVDDKDYIDFSISSVAPWTISPTTLLPAITEPVIIDGTSQEGWTVNSQYINISDGATVTTGLEIAADAVEIYGLHITNFNNGIVAASAAATNFQIGAVGKGNVISANGLGIDISNGSGTIQSNFIGTSVNGLAANGNTGSGIRLQTDFINVGGATAGEGNVISANAQNNIYIADADGTNVYGNFIGTDISGNVALPGTASTVGVRIGTNTLPSSTNRIGGTTTGEGNVISGNGLDGVFVVVGNGNFIYNNLIGIGADGTTALGNGRYGVVVKPPSANTASGNLIGGIGANEANRISNNTTFGVSISPNLGTAINNRILGNDISCNTSGGIELTGGGNNTQAAPAITSATDDGTVTGTGVAGDNIHVYLEPASCPGGAQTYLGTTMVDGLNNWTLTGLSLSVGENVVATQTNGTPTFNGTSAFSAPVTPVTAAPLPTQPVGNRGIYFDGVDDYVLVTGGTDLDFAGNEPFTVEMWVKLDELTAASNLFDLRFTGAGTLGVRATFLADGSLEFRTDNFGTGSQLVTTTTNLIQQNEWHHLAFTSNGLASGKTIYLDGIALTPASTAGTNAYLTATAGSGNFFIGARGEPTPDLFFNGQIDEVRIYNTARTQTEIQADLASSAAGTAIDYWNFDDDATGGNQTTAGDLGSGNNSGTLSTTGTDIPLWALRVTDNTDNITPTAGMLRWAIAEANTDTDTDYIDFSIPGAAPYTILNATATSFTINNPVYIDGTTQEGWALATPVTLEQTGGAVFGFNFITGSANSTILGMGIRGFNQGVSTDVDNIQVGLPLKGNVFSENDYPINLNTGNNLTVQGNIIGLEPDGNTIPTTQSFRGVSLAAGTGHLIGGTTADERNIIAGCTNGGIYVDGVTVSVNILGNYIGTDITGLIDRGNNVGVFAVNGVANIGNGTVAGSNVISGNDFGIIAQVPVNANNNLIGVDAGGTNPLGNDNGILLQSGNGHIITNNTIAYSTSLYGIQINAGVGTSLLNNNIFCNTTTGINLQAGANNDQVAPVITSAGNDGNASGTCATCADGDVVELFVDNSGCNPAQGEVSLGTTTVTSGAWNATGLFLASGDRITALVNNTTNGTSQFSTDFTVTTIIPIQPQGVTGLRFDGTEDFANVIDASGTLDLAALTLEAWIKPSDLTGTQSIIHYGTTGASGYGMSLLGDQLQFSLYGVADYSTSSIISDPNDWYHVAVTYTNAVNGLNFYLNGLLVDTQTPLANNPVVTSNLNIGRDNSGQYFEGQIDEVRIFNAVRTQPQIQVDMSSTTLDGAYVFVDFNDDASGANPTTAAVGSAADTFIASLIGPTELPRWAWRVTNTLDNTSAGSLRYAITQANTDADKDYIDFSIDAAGVQTITPNTLTPITQPVIIDGYSQPGSSENTLNIGNDRVLNIQLDGGGGGSGIGLDISTSNSEVYGLIVHSFGGSAGIRIRGTGNTIAGCQVGIDVNGNSSATDTQRNTYGIWTDADGTIIGLPTPEGRNTVAGNRFQGIRVVGVTSGTIQNNYLGTNPDGNSEPLINQGTGIGIAGSTNVEVGGTSALERNVIGGNNNNGIRFWASAVSNQVIGNYIGVGADGLAVLGTGIGVVIENNVNNIQIGGVATGEGNIIANNTTGVSIETGTGTGHNVRGNSIFANGFGIDLPGTVGAADTNDTDDVDTGSNNLQNYPDLTNAQVNGSNLEIDFSVDATGGNSAYPLEIDIYDSDGTGQGQVYIGSYTYTTPQAAAFAVVPAGSVAIGDEIVLTVTDAGGNTSEFSPDFTTTGPLRVTSFTPTSGTIGTTVTITGTNFNPTPANNTVYFGAVQATPTAGNATSLTVTVPQGATSITEIQVQDVGTGLKGSSITSLTPLYTVTNTPAAVPSYDVSTQNIAGTGGAGSAIGDFNLDGIPDLAIGNTVGSIELFTGNGDGTYAIGPVYVLGNFPRDISIADFNNDGDLDLVTANFQVGTASVLLGNVNATFDTPVNIGVGTGSGPRQVATGDFDNDGDDDFVITNATDNQINIVLGNGDGTFGIPGTFAVGQEPRGITVADFDEDNNLDLAVANETDNTISLLQGQGDGTFIPFGPPTINVGVEPRSLAIGDFNGDGDIDLASANIQSGNNIGIFRGNGDGTFTTQPFINSVNAPGFLAIGDFDGDGNTDIAATDQSGDAIEIVTGNGDFTFNAPISQAVGNTPLSLGVGDLNGDNFADLIVANQFSDATLIISNTCDPAADEAVLTAFYNDTNGASWTNNTGWLGGQPLSNWFGVSTNAEGCVVAIDLPNNNLTGELPPEIADLPNIDIVKLPDNPGIGGEIPVDITTTPITELEINGTGICTPDTNPSFTTWASSLTTYTSSGVACGPVYYWVGNTSVSWNDVTNWSFESGSLVPTATLPTTDARVVVDGNYLNNLDVDISATVNELFIEAGAPDVIIFNGNDLTVTTELLQEDGDFTTQGGANLILLGNLYLTGGTLAVDGGLQFTGNSVFDNTTGTTLEVENLMVSGTVFFKDDLIVITNSILSGEVVTGTNKLQIGNGAAATLTPSGGFVNGTLGYYVDSPTTLVFPLNGYTMSWNVTGILTTGDIEANFVQTNANPITEFNDGGDPITAVFAEGYFEVQSLGAVLDYDVTLSSGGFTSFPPNTTTRVVSSNGGTQWFGEGTRVNEFTRGGLNLPSGGRKRHTLANSCTDLRISPAIFIQESDLIGCTFGDIFFTLLGAETDQDQFYRFYDANNNVIDNQFVQDATNPNLYKPLNESILDQEFFVTIASDNGCESTAAFTPVTLSLAPSATLPVLTAINQRFALEGNPLLIDLSSALIDGETYVLTNPATEEAVEFIVTEEGNIEIAATVFQEITFDEERRYAGEFTLSTLTEEGCVSEAVQVPFEILQKVEIKIDGLEVVEVETEDGTETILQLNQEYCEGEVLELRVRGTQLDRERYVILIREGNENSDEITEEFEREELENGETVLFSRLLPAGNYTYYITIEDTEYDIKTAQEIQLNYTIHENPATAELITADSELVICDGEKMLIALRNLGAPFQYRIYQNLDRTGGIALGNISGNQFEVDQTIAATEDINIGKYYVEVFNSSTGCVSEALLEVQYTVLKRPDFIEVPEKIVVCEGETITTLLGTKTIEVPSGAGYVKEEYIVRKEGEVVYRDASPAFEYTHGEEERTGTFEVKLIRTYEIDGETYECESFVPDESNFTINLRTKIASLVTERAKCTEGGKLQLRITLPRDEEGAILRRVHRVEITKLNEDGSKDNPIVRLQTPDATGLIEIEELAIGNYELQVGEVENVNDNGDICNLPEVAMFEIEAAISPEIVTTAPEVKWNCGAGDFVGIQVAYNDATALNYEWQDAEGNTVQPVSPVAGETVGLEGVSAGTYTLIVTVADNVNCEAVTAEFTMPDQGDGCESLISQEELEKLCALKESLPLASQQKLGWPVCPTTSTDPNDYSGIQLNRDGKVRFIDLSELGLEEVPVQEVEAFEELITLDVSQNDLTFEDLEALLPVVSELLAQGQTPVGEELDEIRNITQDITLTIPENVTGTGGVVTWLFIPEGESRENGEVLGTGVEITIENTRPLEDQGTYYAEITHPDFPGVVLFRRDISLEVTQRMIDTDRRALIEILKKLIAILTGNDSGRVEELTFDEDAPAATWPGVTQELDRCVGLDLSTFELKGEIPVEIGALTALRRLSFFDNQLSGDIPESIGNLKELTYLDLDKNNLSGPVPESITQLSKLKTLWLSRNAFTSIPASMGDLSELEFLLLQENQFTDLPESINNLDALRVLDVSKNKLKSFLPQLPELNALERLNLSGNELTDIELSLSLLPALKELNLSDNQLENLPVGLPASQSLERLYVRRNYLEFDDIEPLDLAVTEYSPQHKQRGDENMVLEVGDRLELNSNIAGSANQYLWFKDGQRLFLSTTPNPDYVINSIIANDAGVYECRVTSTLVPDLVLQTRTFNVSAECGELLKATITTNSETEFCAEDNVYVELKAKGSDEFKYTWLRNDQTLTLANDSTYIAFEVGTYQVQIEAPTGCVATSEKIIISQTGSIDLTIVVDGVTLTVNNDSIDENSIFWLKDGSRVAEFDGNKTITPTENGIYQAAFDKGVGCISKSEPQLVSGVTALDEDFETGPLVVYPNPTENNVTIHFPAVQKVVSILISDIHGKRISLKKYNNVENVQLNLQAMPRGVYLLEMRSAQGHVIKKVTKL